MKTILKSICLLALILSTGTFATAQDISVTDVIFKKLRGTGPIINQNEVQGYYLFYKLNKVDRKTNTYLLKILDNNLNEVSKKTMTGEKTLNLHEVAYNGSSIMLKFFNSDPKEYGLVFKRYDRNAEFKSKKVIPMDKKREAVLYLGAGLKPEDYNALNMYAIEGKGFVDYMPRKNKKAGYSITFLPEEGKGKKWVYKSDEESKEIEEATFLASDGKILVNAITKLPSRTSRDYRSFLLGIDIATGKKLFEKELKDT